MTKPSPTTNCPHCFARIEALSSSPSPSPFKWLLLLLVSAAAFFAGWFAHAPQTAAANTEQGPITGSVKPARGKPKFSPPPSKTLDELLDRLKLESGQEVPQVILETQPSFEKGNLCFLPVIIYQVGSDFILAGTSINSRAYFEFEEQALESVSVAKGDTCILVGRFTGFQEVPLVSGAADRLRAFELVGMNNRSRNSFHSFE
jgi:hypothetical protein